MQTQSFIIVLGACLDYSTAVLLTVFGLHLYWTEWALSLSVTSAPPPVTLAICSFLPSSFLPQRVVSTLDDEGEGEGYKVAHFGLSIHFTPTTISDSSYRGLENEPSLSNTSAKHIYHHIPITSFSSRTSSRQLRASSLLHTHLPHKSLHKHLRFSNLRDHLVVIFSRSSSREPNLFPLPENHSRKSTCSRNLRVSSQITFHSSSSRLFSSNTLLPSSRTILAKAAVQPPQDHLLAKEFPSSALENHPRKPPVFHLRTLRTKPAATAPIQI